MTYTVTVTDPNTGKVKRGKVSVEKPLTERQLAKFRESVAGQSGTAVDAVTIAGASAPSPKAKTQPSAAPQAPDKPAAPPAGTPPASSTGASPGPSWTDTAKNLTKEWGPTALETALYFGLPYAAGPIVGPAISAAGKLGKAGEWMATHPGVVDKFLQTIGAAGIGGVGAKMRGEDVGEAAVTSGGLQALLQGASNVVGPILSRLGPGGIKKLEDETASTIMKKIKDTVPWLKDLPDSHAGIAAMAETGDAAKTLGQNFGRAIEAIKAQIPEGSQTILPMKDAAGVGLMKLTPQDLIHAGEIPVPVSTVDLIDKMHGLWKSDPALNNRLLQALDKVVPETVEALKDARGQYREGIQMVNALRTARAFDEQSGRLNVERLMGGLRTRWGPGGETGTSILEQTTAPKAREVLKSLAPVGEPLPHAKGFGKVAIYPLSGHVGLHEPTEKAVAGLAGQQPKHILYSDVPLTAGQKETIRKMPSRLQAGIELLTK